MSTAHKKLAIYLYEDVAVWSCCARCCNVWRWESSLLRQPCMDMLTLCSALPVSTLCAWLSYQILGNFSSISAHPLVWWPPERVVRANPPFSALGGPQSHTGGGWESSCCSAWLASDSDLFPVKCWSAVPATNSLSRNCGHLATKCRSRVCRRLSCVSECIFPLFQDSSSIISHGSQARSFSRLVLTIIGEAHIPCMAWLWYMGK